MERNVTLNERASVASAPWYAEVTRYQWLVLVIASAMLLEWPAHIGGDRHGRSCSRRRRSSAVTHTSAISPVSTR